ncbi:MAG: hypothetical protein EZS28_025096 [Streblomastix strix]|uniref:Uncharacterized protein n=1 Tax=Streblomastix strix TaxID=222440 RepID=A0A5J4V9Y0_9EUKA|nr:MAG: hypothetical protein EZS28_025096 [Streblomastix strix]
MLIKKNINDQDEYEEEEGSEDIMKQFKIKGSENDQLVEDIGYNEDEYMNTRNDGEDQQEIGQEQEQGNEEGDQLIDGNNQFIHLKAGDEDQEQGELEEQGEFEDDGELFDDELP